MNINEVAQNDESLHDEFKEILYKEYDKTIAQTLDTLAASLGEEMVMSIQDFNPKFVGDLFILEMGKILGTIGIEIKVQMKWLPFLKFKFFGKGKKILVTRLSPKAKANIDSVRILKQALPAESMSETIFFIEGIYNEYYKGD